MMRLPGIYTDRRRPIFLRLLGNGLAQGALAVTSAWLVMHIFEALGSEHGQSLNLFFGLLVALAASALLRRWERIHAEQLGQQYASAVRLRLYRRLLSSNPRDFKKRRKGALLLKFVGDLSALRRWISLGLARLLVAGVAISVALAALVRLHPPFALAVTLILCASAVWIVWYSTALRESIENARRCGANLSANVTEKLNRLATVQAFGQARRERRSLRRQTERLTLASVEKAERIGTLRAVTDATAGACVFAVLALAYFVPPPDLTPGMVAAVISIIGFLTPPLRDLGRAQEYWLAAQVARENLQSLSKRGRRVLNRPGGKPLVVGAGRIRFDSVSVRGALHDIDVEAEGGARVAVLGPNGSGKSTLLGLVGRLFDPDRGRVLIDGQDIGKALLSSVHSRIAYVSADIPLIRGSLNKNLCYGAGKVDPGHLQQVLSDCELDEMVGRMPEGLQTPIAEGGADLSRGERVRVSLARALLSDPSILLLDEADANLDAKAIHALKHVISGFPGTLLMATHRRSALRNFDTFWSLRNGRLEQIGDAADAFADNSGEVVAFTDSGADRHYAAAG